MITLKTKIRSENINKLRAIINGEAISLNAISKIVIKIPSLGVVIEDSTSTSFPIKWIQNPEDIGLIKLQLGNVQLVIDNFIYSTTGDLTNGSEWIENIPSSIIGNLDSEMLVEGTGLSIIPRIIRVDRTNNKIKMSQEMDSDSIGAALNIYSVEQSSIHKCDIYIYNVDYPNGLFWQSFKMEFGI